MIVRKKAKGGDDMAHGPGGRRSPRAFLTEEEKANKPQVTPALLKRIASYLKPYWFQFLLVFLAILLSATVGLFPSLITGRIVDEALVGRDITLLVRLLILAFATLAVSQVIGVMESYINAWISQRIIFDMKNQMSSATGRRRSGRFVLPTIPLSSLSTSATSSWKAPADTRSAPWPRMMSCSRLSLLATRTRWFLAISWAVFSIRCESGAVPPL